MRLLVLCSNYPDNNGSIGLNYVHVRNVFYKRKGYDVVVINFSATDDYVKDDICVLSLSSFYANEKTQSFDVVVCHAANIRNHYKFLCHEKNNIKKIVFFYHGHEVMKLSDYPIDYPYLKKNRFKRLLSPIYDWYKLATWKRYLSRNIDRIELVFVSEWMRDTFLKNIKLKDDLLPENKQHVIYNCISKRFEVGDWDKGDNKKYDYVTIRGNIDTSKFAIDLVNDLAFANPEAKFLIVGKGEFFNHYKKAPNIARIEHYMNQDEIIEVLNDSKCALMPTRLDAQGVMACEMATFGIPVITSDIPVCRYVLSGFSNVAYISNDNKNTNLNDVLSTTSLPQEKSTRFFEVETVQKELDLFKTICNTSE